MKTAPPATIDEYINEFPGPVQKILQQLRKTIQKEAPGAEEKIGYGIPTFTLHGNLVHFAGYKNHIGFYPGAAGIEGFKKELSKYKGAKGSVQFPIDEPLPLALIKTIVKYRVKQNLEKQKKVTPGKSAARKPAPQVKNKTTDGLKEYLDRFPAAVQADINTVRKIILSASSLLQERIKWNAPSYYYKEDIVTFGPYKNDSILLVFHHPYIVTIKSGLLEGTYKDRRLVYLRSKTDISKKKKEIISIISQVVSYIHNK